MTDITELAQRKNSRLGLSRHFIQTTQGHTSKTNCISPGKRLVPSW